MGRPAARWRLRLLGAVEAQAEGLSIARWPARAVTLLLARLAMQPDKAHVREELIELLWPGAAPDVGRNRLRQTLSTLKSLLDQPLGGSSVLQADRLTIRLQAGAVQCDAVEFEAAVSRGHADGAHRLYRGEFMPGYYEEWVNDMRLRLARLHESLPQALEPPVPMSKAALPAPVAGVPAYWTRLFGVEASIDALVAAIRRSRLVTVQGPGGSGKTRLAAETAGRLHAAAGVPGAPGFDRVAYVGLIDCRSAAQTLTTIGDALRAQRGADMQRQIATAVGAERWLLVLDNVEQLLPEADDALARLLALAPTLHLVLTSRRRLGLDGETVLELDGLELPAADAPLEQALANPALALFVDRARAARADFSAHVGNLHTLVHLVRLLGGMPLALELAASRLRSVSAAEMLHALSSGAGTPMLDLLARASPARASADVRHASMRHVVAWSWQQLSAEQAAMMVSLAVFGAPASTAAVAAAAGRTAQQAQSLLLGLHDLSLVRTQLGGEAPSQHSLLQPVREFAAEMAAPQDLREARQRLRSWLIARSAELVRAGPRAVAVELAHVLACLETAAADGEAQAGLHLAQGMRRYWDSDALPMPAVLALEAAVNELTTGLIPDQADAARRALIASACELLAFSRTCNGFPEEGLAHADRALQWAADDARRSHALVRRATTLYHAGRHDEDFDAPLAEALELARAAGDVAAQALAQQTAAVIRCNLRFDFAASERLMGDAQALWESLGQRSMVRMSLLGRAVLWAGLGRIEDGLAVHLDCEADARATGDWLGQIHVTRQLGRLCVLARRWPDAAAAFQRSLAVARERGHAQGMAHALLHLPDALSLLDAGAHHERGARLAGFAAAHWSRTYGALNPIEQYELRRTQRTLRRRLGAARYEVLRIQGRAMALTDAVALGLDDLHATTSSANRMAA